MVFESYSDVLALSLCRRRLLLPLRLGRRGFDGGESRGPRNCLSSHLRIDCIGIGIVKLFMLNVSFHYCNETEDENMFGASINRRN